MHHLGAALCLLDIFLHFSSKEMQASLLMNTILHQQAERIKLGFFIVAPAAKFCCVCNDLHPSHLISDLDVTSGFFVDAHKIFTSLLQHLKTLIVLGNFCPALQLLHPFCCTLALLLFQACLWKGNWGFLQSCQVAFFSLGMISDTWR